ncbi:MAG TPA: alpha/beta fold hydrolase [Pyrinomonadaceae bacterium]|jgi:predicted alpha/beta-hydrolase family hydrolase|nr:alpha/beta fold hydrolase [Pyrinomonadaceae bacterium]
MPERYELIKVSVAVGVEVTAALYTAAIEKRKATTIILAHGAGANQFHPFMQLFAGGLAERGFDVLTFNFQYMEQGRKVPDPKAKLEACYCAVIEAARGHNKLKGNRLVIGGKSMGGRIASQVAATPETAAHISALVFLGYPLHPPGRPDQLRDAHLAHIKAPMLFVQGSRDAFGTAEEIGATIKKHNLPATLHVVEGGDHSLKVPKALGTPQERVYASTIDAIALWL